MVTRLGERLLREQVGLEAQVRGVAHQRERIGDRIHDQVVLALRVAQEGPAVLDAHRYVRVCVRLGGVEPSRDVHDGGIDLDRVDVVGTTLDRHRRVVARSGADHQDAVVRLPREPLVELGVEGERLPVGVQREALVRHPVGVDPDRVVRGR